MSHFFARYFLVQHWRIGRCAIPRDEDQWCLWEWSRKRHCATFWSMDLPNSQLPSSMCFLYIWQKNRWFEFSLIFLSFTFAELQGGSGQGDNFRCIQTDGNACRIYEIEQQRMLPSEIVLYQDVTIRKFKSRLQKWRGAKPGKWSLLVAVGLQMRSVCTSRV